MQYNKYAIQFFSSPNDPSSLQATVAELTGFPELMFFVDFNKLMNFAKLDKLMEKDPPPSKVRTPRKRVELPEKRLNPLKRIPAPRPWITRFTNLVYKLSMMSMIWSISIGHLRLAAWLCSLPALVHLLIN